MEKEHITEFLGFLSLSWSEYSYFTRKVIELLSL